MVARQSPRNRKITATTSSTAKESSICTSCTEARMVSVRSVRTATSNDGGRVSRKVGSRALMLSTTAMTLAPGWRWTLTITAWVEFTQASSLVFSRVAAMLATSRSRTGAPLR